ncbi:MAG: hypothetical protein BWY32_03778 [bacterium ADurb.Bin243]|nr:MAG: hypothetical protein BWY32_03778 [bacterium ADurb.Bin243]HOD40919.1 DUF5706 domain-containing protein [Candidatus Wallbacteria bacterium]
MEKDIKRQISYQFQVYSSSQGLVPLADAKAGAIVGANIALIATLINAPFFYEKLKKIIDASAPSGTAVFLLSVFAVISIISIMSAVMVLYPRPSQHVTKLHPARLTYFEHIFSCRSAERYLSRVGELDDGEILQEMCVQNYELSTILIAKYKMLKTSLALFLANMIIWAALIFKFFQL